MADSSNDTIIRLKTEADNSGAKSAEKALDKVGNAAERAGKNATSAGEKASSSAEKASSAFGKLGAAVKGFTKALGYIGLAMRTVEMLVGALNKVRDWLNRDKRAAEELARAIQDGKIKEAIEESAAAYERLNAKIAETLRLEQERDRLADRRLGQERAIEDAQTELEMQRELAGLDRDDPDYQQNAALVRSKYARVRADRAAKRAQQDNRIAQARRYEQADEKEKEANEIENKVYGRAGDAVIALKGQIHDEKDPERKKQMESQLESLVAEQKKRLAEAKKLRDEAASLRKEAEAELGSYTAAKITAQAANVAQDAADADTRRQIETGRAAREKSALEKRRREAEAAARKAADEKTVAEGGPAIAGLERDADAERARAQTAADAYARESADVFAAQNRYDMLKANGGSRKERSAALAALQKEQREAEEAKHEMERVAAQVANTLQGINTQIKALASAVKKAEGRLAQNQADAPEG